MAHFSNTLETRKSTPAEWLRVGKQIGELVNAWSYRTDLVVNLGETTTGDVAAALYNPASAEIEVNTKVAFGAFTQPDEIEDINKRSCQLEFPVAAGAIFHEALHARFTRWSLQEAFETVSPEDYKALHHLEEGRIEAFGIRTTPSNRILLRSSALEIALADIDAYAEKLSTVSGAAFLCALTLARVDAGVLEEEDVEPMMELIEEILTPEVIEKLRSVWLRFQAHEDHANPLPLYALASEWNSILQELREERNEESGDGEQGEGAEGSEGSEGAEGSEGLSEERKEELKAMAKKLIEALKDARDHAKISNQGNIDDAQSEEEHKEEIERRTEDAKERGQSKAVADEVFGRGTGNSVSGKSRSRLLASRTPSADERVAAVTVSRMLEKAKYRERSATEINSIIPPGRLRTRALVQGHALKAKGVNQQPEAWRRTLRKHTDDPTLRIGVMVDISGSMSSAMEPMAITAWVMSEASRRVQGKTAMVYYGNDVFPTLKSGQHLKDVNVWTASDGTEEFDKAFKALDGSLNLLHGDGARMLVVVSDGYYRDDQRELARRWLKKCQRNGVAVMWITFDDGSSARYLTRGTDTELIIMNRDDNPAKAATEIGKASASALSKVGLRNG